MDALAYGEWRCWLTSHRHAFRASDFSLRYLIAPKARIDARPPEVCKEYGALAWAQRWNFSLSRPSCLHTVVMVVGMCVMIGWDGNASRRWKSSWRQGLVYVADRLPKVWFDWSSVRIGGFFWFIVAWRRRGRWRSRIRNPTYLLCLAGVTGVTGGQEEEEKRKERGVAEACRRGDIIAKGETAGIKIVWKLEWLVRYVGGEADLAMSLSIARSLRGFHWGGLRE